MSMEKDLRELSSKVDAEMRRMKTKKVFGKDSVSEEEISARVKKSTDDPDTLLWFIAYDRDKNRRRIAWDVLEALIRHTRASHDNGEYLILRWLQEVVSLARDADLADEALKLRVEIKRNSRH